MKNEDKCFFDRKILYLDYYERGEKVKNGGFVKLETRQGDCRVQIHVRGLYATDTMQGDILLGGGGREAVAERMQIRYGTGECTLTWRAEDLADTGISYGDLESVKIRLSENKHLAAVLGKVPTAEKAEEGTSVAERTPAEQMSLEQGSVEREAVEGASARGAENLNAGAVWAERTPMEQMSLEQGSVERESAEGASARGAEKADEGAVRAERTPVEQAGKPGEMKAEQEAAGEEPLSPDKWEQLTRMYPKIRPFGDEREYLSVTPGDFVILSARFQNLVQNSFLLHGYYNYGHVALTRIGEKDNVKYYLGVPGVYFEQEKQAALLFGFEGFEADKGKVEEGGFGYYMIRVEI